MQFLHYSQELVLPLAVTGDFFFFKLHFLDEETNYTKTMEK